MNKTYVARFASTHDRVIDTKCITSQKISNILNFYPQNSNNFFFKKEILLILIQLDFSSRQKLQNIIDCGLNTKMFYL